MVNYQVIKIRWDIGIRFRVRGFIDVFLWFSEVGKRLGSLIEKVYSFLIVIRSMSYFQLNYHLFLYLFIFIYLFILIIFLVPYHPSKRHNFQSFTMQVIYQKLLFFIIHLKDDIYLLILFIMVCYIVVV